MSGKRDQTRIVYGRETLEAVASGALSVMAQSPTAMQVALDLSARSDDLDVLCVVCQVIKGGYEGR